VRDFRQTGSANGRQKMKRVIRKRRRGRETHAPAGRFISRNKPRLLLLFGRGRGLCRKLEHGCFLAFHHVGQEHDLSIRKLQRIMMRPRLVLVHLSKDGRRMIERTHFQAKQPARPAPDLAGKGKLRSWKNTNRGADIFRCGEPARAGIEVAGGQFVANLGWT